MNGLLLYPKFPPSFWSFEKALELTGAKALQPSLSLVTVAALLPQHWDFKLVDHNLRSVSEAEWAWADIILISGMIAQKADMLALIREARQRGKRVAVGGPYATSLPDEVQATGANFLVLDEGEVTIPLFIDALERGCTEGVFRSSEKPDITMTPVPRFDLLQMDAYDTMPVQYSRGCPFLCEFCDIINLYGRVPRTKTPAQVLAEFDGLYKLGWRGPVFLVDDNFIGNKRNAKVMLRALHAWQVEHDYPFLLVTEASLDLAQDAELMELMVLCNFKRVFLGIETPDAESLVAIRKNQNVRTPLLEALDTISKAGLQIMAGLIVGFDGEKRGAGKRIEQLVEAAAIPVAFFSMLQALPNTAMWTRLEKERRLIDGRGDMNQTTLSNFIPTRPIEEIAEEYMDSLSAIYEPERYLDRAYRQAMSLGTPAQYAAGADLLKAKKSLSAKTFKAMLILIWRNGIRRNTRRLFWRHIFALRRSRPELVIHYLRTCAFGEHFFEYRHVVRRQISKQLPELDQGQKNKEMQYA